jgi:excisionase family DNA binding protein
MRAEVSVRAFRRDDDLLKPREAAELLGVRTTTVARWAREGRLPSVSTPGGHRRYRLLDVGALIERANGVEGTE